MHSRDEIAPSIRLGTCLLLLSVSPFAKVSLWKPGHLRGTCVRGRKEFMCSQPCLGRKL